MENTEFKEPTEEVEQPIEETQPQDEMLADLEAIDKKKHPNKQKEVKADDGEIRAENKGKDLISREEVLAKVEPCLGRVRRHGVVMNTREVLALVNGIIADIKNMKGEKENGK